ncbi:FYVE-FINGER-CONTAINING RAB5 EFFECTOR PROTEIN RABENOSYN-5-RELATED [Plasmopara halstedii]|uniref:FYVE-FINGER-CONTAINING RAB5 EFFECTOR PROTEIN RABENOSYN-5-RELATED n=1 Tax=Plasmopara halstedii TaxID=4781 RepID=A0A0P1B093_PLAHL|nr:FYVE-FINGER-CONTAINING RAB5 EFFECTOR PROTEIN RABENOSYN-5-RELATED [Plasmopara halstedii]CEG46692.1 FYVE-FINGER-CONTAINING RAB5 EFFECTOR PROTEIN RABENOSYN-5-RELATED [Plasmopara halstedii]|eukprot:XP_024583061.1 FYVE-FINGER-CONTAINING RAB5 EFFECTOR PROTEIN RABENOSYN-5-RELATED [Plasmopara halstedii]
MKFPLPANTFPSLLLSQHDQAALKSLAEAFVDDAMVEYRTFRSPPLNGTIDETCFKFIKKRDGLTSYLDRKHVDRALETSSIMRDSIRENMGTKSSSKKLLGVLTVGTIDGTLNDQMYGMHHYSTELMRIKSAYMDDSIVDGRILSEICPPTPEDPGHGLYIKWCVSDFAPTLLHCIIRPRDFVYLDGTGIIVDEITGERIGYSVSHSLEIPSIRELSEYQIVRATVSICALFRQKAHGVVEVYLKGYVDSKGDIHTRIAISTTSEALMSYRRGTYCGQMKKLNWLLKTKRTVMLDQSSGICSVCQKTVKKLSSFDNSCQVCMNQVCSSCCEIHKLAFLSTSRQVIRRNLLFCARCLRVAKFADGLEVASEELRRLNPLEYFEIPINDDDVSTSPSRSTLPDAQQEFFGAL